jgi:hypothetical protein
LERQYYVYAGLRIRSDFPIPEWAVFENSDLSPDPEVIISLDREASNVTSNLPIVTADEYHFRVPEIGVYRVRRGREIIVTPASNAGQRELRLFLLGSAWGALCYQRGLLCLHSSAVGTKDGAVVFGGPSGSGKSTVAAWLINRGFRFAGDDLCRFDPSTGGCPQVYPSAPRLKLWLEALGPLGRDEADLERDHFRQEKYHVPLPGAEKSRPLPLLGIYLLEWGDPGLIRLTGRSALGRLVAGATYRGDLLEPMGRLAAHWERCAELVRRVPVWEFRRPKDWGTLENSMNLWLAHFRS